MQKNINFKKQWNNKKKIINLKRELPEKVRRRVYQKVNKINRALRAILIQTIVRAFTHNEIIYHIPMYARKANCGFMRTYRPCYIGSEEKVLYCFAYLCFSTTGRQVLPHIIKEVDIREQLYSQQFIYHWQTNPEPREKLRLMILHLSDFSRPLHTKIGIIWTCLKILLSRCSKAVSNIDENNKALKLLLVTFHISLVVGLDLWARNALVSPVL